MKANKELMASCLIGISTVFAIAITGSILLIWIVVIVIILLAIRRYMPMVSADMKRVKSLLPLALSMGVKFRILKFEKRTDITDEVVEVK